MELSLWANHPKDQPSLIEGRRTPSVNYQISGSWLIPPAKGQPTSGTNRRSFWALSALHQFRKRFGLRPPCHTPQPEL